MRSWSTVVARVRGLAARLLPPPALARLRQAVGWEEVRAALAARGLALGAELDALATEEAIRRLVGSELRILDRWLSTGQRRALAPFFADEDRRSLRRILRGQAEGLPPASRLAGALPTPTLPARALEELARQPTAATVVGLLAILGSSFAIPLATATRGAESRLLRLELALDRAFAAQVAAARRECGAVLRRTYALWIDTLVAGAALTLAGGASELPPEECFLAGGETLSREAYLAAARAPTPTAAARLLAPSFTGELGRALRLGEGARDRLEAALLSDALATQRSLARRRPLSSAPVALYLLSLRQNSAELRQAAWRAALGMAGAAA